MMRVSALQSLAYIWGVRWTSNIWLSQLAKEPRASLASLGILEYVHTAAQELNGCAFWGITTVTKNDAHFRGGRC